VLLNLRDSEKVLETQCELTDVKLTIDENNINDLYALVGSTDKLIKSVSKNVNDLGIIFFTSGATGHGKAVMHTIGNLLNFSNSTIYSRLSHPAERIYVVPKMFSAYGFMTKFLCPLWGGAKVYLDSEMNTPLRIKHNIENFKPTTFWAFPVIYAQLLGKLSDINHMKCYSAGDILPQKVLDAWLATTGQGITNIYGSTEFFMISSNKTGKTTNLGPPAPEFQIRIVDNNEQPVPNGTPGTLEVKSFFCTTGYYKDEYWTKQMFSNDGWMRTNDIVYLDAEGNLNHLGRSKEVIKTARGWINPSEIENVLISHEAIEQAAVISVEGDNGIDRIEAYLVPAPNTNLNTIDPKVWVRENLNKHSVPSTIHIVDSLPRTTTGKLQRFRLKEKIA
jgi:acyl-coenzyme A synthetase/AMP-(fatty) acid ligase